MPETLKMHKVARTRKLEKKALKVLSEKVKAKKLKTEMVNRAQKYLSQYKKLDKHKLSLLKNAEKNGDIYCPDEPRLAFVVRIRGINGVPPKPKKVMQLFRLRQINNGMFIKLNKATLNMLRMIDPYVFWGYPNLKSIRDLVYKRGFIREDGKRMPMTNELIRKQLGKYGIICVEDIVNQIYTVGPYFKQVVSSLWHFKLNNPSGGFRRKSNHFVEGGDFGNREEYVNKILRKMI